MAFFLCLFITGWRKEGFRLAANAILRDGQERDSSPARPGEWENAGKEDKLIEISGIYASVSVHVAGDSIDAIEPYAAAQLKMLCVNPAADGSKIHVMPDVHPGKVCTIGLTMTIGGKILPNWIGADIGRGVTIAKLNKGRLDFKKLDTVIRESVPSGFISIGSMHFCSLKETGSHSFRREGCSISPHKLSGQKGRCIGLLGGGDGFC